MSQLPSQLSSSTMPPMTLTPKADFLLIPRTVTLQDGERYTFTDRGLGNLISFFKSLRRGLAIDYEHQTLGSLPGFEHFKSPDGTAPAAGWIAGLEIRPDGLWAKNATWTARAQTLLATGEYRYFSPVLFWPKNNKGESQQWKADPVAIGPAALTNDPDINGLSAVAARCSHEQLLTLMKESTMDWKKLLAELMGLDASSPDDQLATACKAKWKEAGEALTASKALPELQTKVTGLETELATARAAGGEITALKSTHGTEVTALKATHAGEITALKGAHTVEVTSLREQLAGEIVTRLEETGRIAPADKATVLASAKADPKLTLTAFKAVKPGAVVPVGTLGLRQGKGGSATIRSKHDQISTSKAFHDASPEVQQKHLSAVAYAEENGCTYTEAVKAVEAQETASQ